MAAPLGKYLKILPHSSYDVHSLVHLIFFTLPVKTKIPEQLPSVKNQLIVRFFRLKNSYLPAKK